MHWLANQWVSTLIKYGANKEDKEIYLYGAECFLNDCFINFLLLVIAVLCKKPLEMLLWIFFFTLLRIHLGGYHASSHFRCIVLSLLIGFCCIFSCPFLAQHFFVIVIGSFLSILITFLSPVVTHPNHPVSIQKQKDSKHRAKQLVILESFFCLFSYFFFTHQIAAAIMSGILSAALLNLLGYIKSLKHNNNKPSAL